MKVPRARNASIFSLLIFNKMCLFSRKTFPGHERDCIQRTNWECFGQEINKKNGGPQISWHGSNMCSLQPCV